MNSAVCKTTMYSEERRSKINRPKEQFMKIKSFLNYQKDDEKLNKNKITQ